MESVASKLSQLTTSRILVIGDVMLDRYWMGNVDRISPEAPVPIVSVNQTEERLGGAGNVARNITALDGHCTLMGIVGNDTAGRTICDIASQSGVDVCTEIEEGYETVIKLRMLSKNQQLIRADFESIPSQASREKMKTHFQKLIDKHDVIVFSDYGKGALSEIEYLINLAIEQGKAVLVDPKGVDFGRYRNATMITPNLAEFQAVAGEVTDDEDLRAKAMQLIEQYNFDQLLVTLSDKGMTLFKSQGDAIHVEAQSQEVFDVSGAGDTVIAVMAMSMGCGMDNESAIEIANSAAGAVISKLGTATTNQTELRSFMSEHSPEVSSQ